MTNATTFRQVLNEKYGHPFLGGVINETESQILFWEESTEYMMLETRLNLIKKQILSYEEGSKESIYLSKQYEAIENRISELDELALADLGMTK